MFSIDRHRIEPGQPCFVIAEAGVNHNGSMALAKQLIDLAAKAGADAVKFQTFIPELVVADCAPKANYQLETTDHKESQLEMERRLALPFEAFYELKDHCDRQGIIFLSSPFDVPSVEFLAQMPVPALKIPSGEMTHFALLRAAAKTGIPIILSTGMSDLNEVALAVDELKRRGCRDLALLHCTSNYPTEPADCNLRAMQTLADHFKLPCGYSDHTLGVEASMTAVAMGAVIIEKHFTLDRSMEGPDHQASLDGPGLTQLVLQIRKVETMMGRAEKVACDSEANTKMVARRSLFPTRPLSAGHQITRGDLVALRPAGGIPGDAVDQVIGKIVRRDLQADDMIAWDDIQ